MQSTSLSILNGTHKIYKRLINQIPRNILKTLDTHLIQASFSFKKNDLIATITVAGNRHWLVLAIPSKTSTSNWVPHPALKDKNEILAIKAMLLEFKEKQFLDDRTLAERKQVLRQTCESFFRKTYR